MFLDDVAVAERHEECLGFPSRPRRIHKQYVLMLACCFVFYISACKLTPAAVGKSLSTPRRMFTISHHWVVNAHTRAGGSCSGLDIGSCTLGRSVVGIGKGRRDGQRQFCNPAGESDSCRALWVVSKETFLRLW